MKYLVLCLSIIIFVRCSDNEGPIAPLNQQSYFGIYFLADTLLTEMDVRETPIEKLALDDIPWLSDDDIEFYDFSSHCIYLKIDKSRLLNYYKGKPYHIKYSRFDKPFVFVAGSERCYIGCLHNSALSTIPFVPTIGDLDILFYYPSDILHISRSGIRNTDTRNNLQLKQNLIENNKYRAGIDFKLTSVSIIENSDISTLEYSIKISNNDSDDLMIIDPDKMGGNSFHYFNNGPVLKSDNYYGYYESSKKVVVAPVPYDSWDNSWFTLVKSKQSIERTIRLKGYPHFPSGKYDCFMEFANPVTIPKNKRLIDGNRIWIGEIESNLLSFIYP